MPFTRFAFHLPFSSAVLGIALSMLGLSAGAQSLNPTGNIAIHDPSSLVKEGGTYYVFQTGNLIPCKTSPDMVHWTNAGSALSSRPSWQAATVPNNAPGDLWAPDISYRNGTYWLYYAVSSSGSQTSALGLATRSSLAAGAWQDQGVVITSATYSVNDNAIDPNSISDAQGNVWLAWGSWWNGIFLIPVDPQTGKPTASAQPVNLAGRGGKGIEAAFIVYARGYYYLFTSWDVCCQGTSSTYNMRYGRATEVTGPYVDTAGLPLVSGGGTPLSDGSGFPGGGQSVYVENGNYYLIYHVYDGRNNPASLQIRHLYFNAQAWPTFDPAAAVSIQPRPSSHRPLLLSGTHESPPAFFTPTGRKLRDPAGTYFLLPGK